MKVELTADTLKQLLSEIDKSREEGSVDDLHSANDDEEDTVTLEFDYGYYDKKKKEHIEVSCKDIMNVEVQTKFICYYYRDTVLI